MPLIDTSRASGVRTLRRVSPFLWPTDDPGTRRRVVLSMLALVVAKLATVATPYFFKLGVDALTPGETAADPAFLILVGPLALTAFYGLMRLAGVVFAQLRDGIFARVGQRAMRLLALETFRHVHALSLRYHITRRTGGLNRIIDRGVKGVDFLLRYLLFSVVPMVLELVLVAVILAWVFDLWYLVAVVVTVVACVAFTFRVTEWRLQVRERMNQQDNEANQKAVDSLLNFETVKYFSAEDREAMRYDASMRGYERAAVQTGESLAWLNAGQSLIITGGLIAMMMMAAAGVQRGTLTVGDFVMVNAYMIQIMTPLGFLGTVYREIRQSMVDMGAMFDLLERPAEVVDREGAVPLKVGGGRIEFRKVDFGYEAERAILTGLDLVVEPGRTVAVVGASGAGKSTIGRLLYRFYDVTGGAVLIDGQDVRDVTQASLRAAIGIVPQDTVLFNDTLYYNIAYGRPDARRVEVEAAARAARIHDFIERLPQGYETAVGERGLKLSGGEKQRVGIARTLLKDPQILLLDEATSALDSETERGIQASLAAMSVGRSVIMIAHRLSTVVDADLIVVLDHGRVVESGTHVDLLARGGRYAAMWQRQLSEPEVVVVEEPERAELD
jgi:ABC-type transport system involved in Fe-S cluster assembly fused permease/ATPase subunit